MMVDISIAHSPGWAKCGMSKKRFRMPTLDKLLTLVRFSSQFILTFSYI